MLFPLGPLLLPDRREIVQKELSVYGKKLSDSAFNNQVWYYIIDQYEYLRKTVWVMYWLVTPYMFVPAAPDAADEEGSCESTVSALGLWGAQELCLLWKGDTNADAHICSRRHTLKSLRCFPLCGHNKLVKPWQLNKRLLSSDRCTTNVELQDVIVIGFDCRWWQCSIKYFFKQHICIKHYRLSSLSLPLWVVWMRMICI